MVDKGIGRKDDWLMKIFLLGWELGKVPGVESTDCWSK